MEISESDILNWIKFEDYRKVVEACEATPKSGAEIARLIGDPKRAAEILDILERYGALKYTEDGWKATEIAIMTLKKYFM